MSRVHPGNVPQPTPPEKGIPRELVSMKLTTEIVGPNAIGKTFNLTPGRSLSERATPNTPKIARKVVLASKRIFG